MAAKAKVAELDIHDWDAVQVELKALKRRSGKRIDIRSAEAHASLLDDIQAGRQVRFRRPRNYNGTLFAMGDVHTFSKEDLEDGDLFHVIKSYVRHGVLMSEQSWQREGDKAAAADFETQCIVPIEDVIRSLEMQERRDDARVQLMRGALRDAEGALSSTQHNLRSHRQELGRALVGGKDACTFFYNAEKQERRISDKRARLASEREAARQRE